jgi:PHP family Zn ribbon phosphoesterase
MAKCELGKHGTTWDKTELYWVCPECVSKYDGETARLKELELLKAEQQVDTRRPWFSFIPYAAISAWVLVIILLLVL